MSSLSEFTAELRNNNLSRPYLYEVEIIKPKCMEDKTYKHAMINMFCSGASTPFVNMYTNDDYNESGIKRKYTYDYDYQNLLLQFYVDQNYDTKAFFDDWIKKIVPNNRKFEYYEEYRSPLIKVSIINTAGSETYKYIYEYAVPKTVSNIDLTYSGTGSVSTFTVEFVFETMKFEKIQQTSSTTQTT